MGLIQRISEISREIITESGEHGIDPFLKIENLSSFNLTDNISQKHLDSKEVYFISHPGWDRLYFPEGEDSHTHILKFLAKAYPEERSFSDKKRVKMLKTLFMHMSGPYIKSLRNELKIEELLKKANEMDNPVIITVPTFLYNSLKNDVIYKNTVAEGVRHLMEGGNFRSFYEGIALGVGKNRIISRTNKEGLFKDYLVDILKGFDNIYLLPTNETNGSIVDDIYAEEGIYTDEKYENWTLGIERSTIVPRLIEPFSRSKWETLNLAGGQVNGCIFNSSKYFPFMINLREINMMGDYLVSKEVYADKGIVEDFSKHELRELAFLSRGFGRAGEYETASTRCLEIFDKNFKDPFIETEVKSLSDYIDLSFAYEGRKVTRDLV